MFKFTIMDSSRLNRKDFILIAICLLMLVIAGYYEFTHYDKAFPEHTIDFKISRKASRDIALQFLNSMNVQTDNKTHAVAFDFDNSAKIFIEKEIGVEESRDLLTTDFRIWQWTNRWFQPLSREEIIVAVTPKGEITRFEHKIPEETAAPLLSIDDARRISRLFLNNSININLDDWEFIEDKTEVKPNRVDYLFTYKKKNIEIYNATYRFDVVVQGDRIGKYREYLHIPEEWKRNYQCLRSLNSTTATAADFLFILILVAILVVFIIHLSKKQINLKTPIILGVVTFGLRFLSKLNLLPLHLFYFDTNQSFGAFYSSFFVGIFLQSLLLGLVVIVLTGGGEYIYQSRYPGNITLGRLLTSRGLRTRHFFFSVIVGISLAIVFMAFQTAFYLVAKHYGAWVPADISYSDILNTAFPWILILVGGFLPAVLEEFSFRLFSIPFLEKILKSRLLAIFIPAVIWGFAHANYPNQPFWIRGFEISIFGIIIGFIFLKFGIMAVLIWHYTIDALYSSLILFRTGDPYLVASASVAVGIMLIPFVYNIIMYLKNRGFSDYQSLLIKPRPYNDIQKEDDLHQDTGPTLTASYQKLPAKQIKIGFVLLVIFILIQFLPLQRIGEFYNYPIPRAEIRQAAIDFLKGKGVDPDNFRNTIALENNYSALAGKYILKHSTVKRLNTTLAQHLKNSIVWKVRFYRLLEKEEYIIYIHPNEKVVVGFDHLIPEDAEAFSLDKDGARFRAEEFLFGAGYPLSDFILIEDYSRQLENRKEYTFIWESKDDHSANVEMGKLRLKILISGDEVSSYSISYKIPEEWEHRETRKTLLDSLRLAAQIFSLGLIAVFTIVIFSKRFKTFSVQWKIPLIGASVIGGLWLIAEVLNYPYALIDYNSSWSIGVWTIFWLLVTLLRTLLITGLLFLLMAIVTTIYPESITTLRRDCRYRFSRDGVLSAVLVTAGLFAVFHIINWLKLRYAPTTIYPDFQIPGSINYFFPLVHSILSLVIRAIVYTALVGIIIYWVKEAIAGKTLRLVIVALLLAVFIPHRFQTLNEFIVHYLCYSLIIAWVW
ncbi:MAG TPA: hypothetical protein DHW42_06700, partial [Candidatus Marinimicrobia bacterium]|nr:hypothetical protein [Candidatus Neomarinimicrobiota bacterium]